MRGLPVCLSGRIPSAGTGFGTFALPSGLGGHDRAAGLIRKPIERLRPVPVQVRTGSGRSSAYPDRVMASSGVSSCAGCTGLKRRGIPGALTRCTVSARVSPVTRTAETASPQRARMAAAAIIFVVFVSLEQMAIGTALLTAALQIGFGAVSLALALTCGPGGREWAAGVIKKLTEK